MKLFKKIRKNNKGLSLVELVCAVAIFGVATTAIGSAMVVSAQSYSRGTYELDVQQEAQITTNLIGNLLVDSVDASFDDTTDALNPVLVIDGENVTCKITFDSLNGILNYEEEDSEGNKSEGILAENVTNFAVDLSKYDDNKSAKVTLQIEKNSRIYDASYSTTSRNATAENVGVNKEAVIQMESEVVLEPGQSYTFDIYLGGMSIAEAGGLVKSGLTGTDVGSSTLVWNGTNSVTLFVADDAYGEMYFNIETGGYKKDDAGNNTTDKLDTHTVTVKVRRVNNISAIHTLVSGTDYLNGAVYRVDATAIGTNLSKKLGKSYDMDYINPNYLDISFSMKDSSGNALPVNDYINVQATQENVDAPYAQFSLKQDMPIGSAIYVTFDSKHARGVCAGDSTFYNKASKNSGSADSYSTVILSYEIKRLANGPWNTGDGIERGDKQRWYYENGSLDKQAFLDADPTANKYTKYYRFWEVGATEPGPNEGWILVGTTGTLDLQMQELYSSIFRPDKAYVVELRLEIRSDSGVVWPTVSTHRSEYITRDTVSIAEVAFKNEALNINDFTTSVGTASNPVKINTLTDYKFKLDLIGLKEESVGNSFKYIVQEYDETYPTKWKNTSNYEISGSYESGNVYLKVKSQAGGAGKKIRILTTLDFKVTNVNGDGSLSEPASPTNYPLYNLTTGSGVLYFEFNN